MRELTAGPVHQVFHFTDAFMQGEPGADPVEATQEWVAGVQGDGAPLGWLRVAGGGGSAAPVMWQPDPPGAAAFLASSACALVQVPWDYAYFTLVDGVVTPVKVQSWDAGLGPRDLAQVQADFAVSRAETAAAYACCSPSDGCAGGGSALSGAAASGSSGGGDGEASCGPGLPSPGVLALAGVATLLAAGTGWTAVRQRRTRTGGAVTSR
ncbi:hypothetical protein [Quadrisphaera setariae]|uniref:MYXO-CTERM domain-containing protein n=1 Tax=Quadrisphaera setariae TaxID=2593304 RepID=A0A5C8ZK46_9ACTN|nr:hypothetical protein [Quadrisphaera setariae]TXR57286.1 hypothetical protein FMM08_03140 [Quadrisphaera setariae]